ncbi:MAG TPA: hypothetical protein VG253_02980 [Streptosporangiaceae bacterium]|jgi:hypothetical protein|nr:hypothetical protein [Streptosporangiaceae bacterium]
MVTRLSARPVRRSPLPLTERDLAALARFRKPGPAWDALWYLAGEDRPHVELTESALLHAVFEAGLRAVQEAAEAASYASDAAGYEAEDAERRQSAGRRRPPWAGED